MKKEGDAHKFKEFHDEERNTKKEDKLKMQELERSAVKEGSAT